MQLHAAPRSEPQWFKSGQPILEVRRKNQT